MEPDAIYYSSGDQCGKTESPVRELETLTELGSRAERVASELNGFISRFHGTAQVASLNQEKSLPPCGYTGQIRRIAKTIERLENLSSSLSSIG
jgi:hypothetical protein